MDVCVTENEEGKLFAQPILYLKGEDVKKEELAFKNTREIEKVSSGNPNTPEEKSDVKHKVKTGDMINLLLWSVFLVISGMVLIIAILQKYRMRREEKEHE